jgi:hypothetical protein
MVYWAINESRWDLPSVTPHSLAKYIKFTVISKNYIGFQTFYGLYFVYEKMIKSEKLLGSV